MKLLSSLFILAFTVSSYVSADEQYNHFPSLQAPDLKIALCNLQSYNQKLSAITSKDELTATDMVKIHELTYTLENAVARMQSELVKTAENLEKVHKASERLDQKAIATFGQKYFELSNMLADGVSCKDSQ